MPILDMSQEKLRDYLGCTPRPADFDAFWDKQLKDIHAFNGKYEFTPYENVQLKNYTIENLYFYAPDGSRISARVTRPAAEKKYPVLFRFHGKGGNIGAVNGDLSFAAAGFAVVAMNCRSQSGDSNDLSDRGLLGQAGLIVRGLSEGREHLYYKDVYLDVVRLTDIIKAQPFCDKDKLFAHGGSQGGGLTVACAALCPEIVAAVPVYPFLSDYKRLYEMDLMKNAYDELGAYIRCFCPTEGEERDAMWTTLGYIDIQNFAPRVKADVLWFTGLMDNVCPPSTQYACYNKLSCKKDIVVYTNHAHEGNWRTDEAVLKFLTSYIE